ncbi:MAG TPA: hypothetical protein VGE07_01715 [Herpetosiphonaceae bacterium]
MDHDGSMTDRRCPDCGTTLALHEDGVFFCEKENVTWLAYGPKLLIRPPAPRELRLSLALPWEDRKAA